MRSLRSTAVGVAALLALSAGPVAGAVVEEDHVRGDPVSVTPLGERDRPRVVEQAQRAGYPTDTARFGVAAYRLTYRTVTPDGRPTTASGLLALPHGGAHRLPAVLHGHGTLAYRGYAPSVAEGPDRTVSLLYAPAGPETARSFPAT
ncbi:hypothetical protein [Streptomyces sp. NPDC048442]|uniref:hypothetical protein n=1 Tax=Streptomyces sp. NPDC048442 TaxID=3154823 RepID=UPI00342C6501